MLFFQELQTSSSSNGETGPHSRELLDELDLRRAHGRLCYGDMLASSSANIHKPWHSSIASAAGSLLALLDESTSQSSHSIQAMDVAMLRRSLAITAGPIPGVCLYFLYYQHLLIQLVQLVSMVWFAGFLFHYH